MQNEKSKILKMLEGKRISVQEAEDLLSAVEGVSRGESAGAPGNLKELRMAIYAPVGAEAKRSSFPLEEIMVSALMNKINLELRHFGISASMEEITNIKESIMGKERFVLNKGYKKAEIWME